MNNKRRNQPHISTKQALTLTNRQRAFRLSQPDNKTGNTKPTTKETKRTSSC